MKDKEREVLEKYGATNIKYYSLVNNYGFTFEIDNEKFDVRYWANCYGVAINKWSVETYMVSKKLENETRNKITNIEKELNELN